MSDEDWALGLLMIADNAMYYESAQVAIGNTVSNKKHGVEALIGMVSGDMSGISKMKNAARLNEMQEKMAR